MAAHVTLPSQVEEAEPRPQHRKSAKPILKTSSFDGPTSSGLADDTELARIESALDRISKQVDACLTHLLHGGGAVPPTVHATRENHVVRGEPLFAIVPGPEAIPQSDGHLAEPTPLRQQVVSFGSESRQGTVAWCDDTSEEEAPDHDDAAPRVRRNVTKARTVDLKIATQIFGCKDEQAASKPMMRLLYRSRCDDIWELLDDPESSRGAWWISQTLKVLVIISLFVTNLQVTQEPVMHGVSAAFLETTFDIIFLTEFLCRIFSAPSKREYIKDPFNWADVLSAFGFPLRMSIGIVLHVNPHHVGSPVEVILLFVLPIIRLLKLLRYFETFRLLIDAFKNSLEALPVLMYTLALIVMLASTLLYLIETRTAIPSLQHALWLCVVTMTTVGYGDYVPNSPGGYVVVSVLVIVSVLFVAMPVGIIGHEFTSCWQTRDRVLCITRARQAMVKWGYSASDVKVLFEYVDVDHDGNLDLLEFIELIRQMRVGLSVERSVGLFMLFDDDQNGSINYMEFMRHVFPQEFVEEAKKDVMQYQSSDKVQDALQELRANRGDAKAREAAPSPPPM